MTSIVKDRPSDMFFDLINYNLEVKETGADKGTEFPKALAILGDLAANRIKQGKMSQDDIENMEAYVTCFVGENKDFYLSRTYPDLERAAKTFLEGTYVAREELEKRNIQARPIQTEGYTNSLRKTL